MRTTFKHGPILQPIFAKQMHQSLHFSSHKITKPVVSSYGQYERRKKKSCCCQSNTSNNFTIKTTMAGSARSMRPTQIAPVQSTVTTSSQSLQWCCDGDLSDPKNVSCVRGPVWWKLSEKTLYAALSKKTAAIPLEKSTRKTRRAALSCTKIFRLKGLVSRPWQSGSHHSGIY